MALPNTGVAAFSAATRSIVAAPWESCEGAETAVGALSRTGWGSCLIQLSSSCNFTVVGDAVGMRA